MFSYYQGPISYILIYYLIVALIVILRNRSPTGYPVFLQPPYIFILKLYFGCFVELFLILSAVPTNYLRGFWLSGSLGDENFWVVSKRKYKKGEEKALLCNACFACIRVPELLGSFYFYSYSIYNIKFTYVNIIVLLYSLIIKIIIVLFLKRRN